MPLDLGVLRIYFGLLRREQWLIMEKSQRNRYQEQFLGEVSRSVSELVVAQQVPDVRSPLGPLEDAQVRLKHCLWSCFSRRRRRNGYFEPAELNILPTPVCHDLLNK